LGWPQHALATVIEDELAEVMD